MWRDTQDLLITANEGLVQFLWLRTWAQTRITAYEERAERQRRRLAGLYVPRALVEGSAVAHLPLPALTADIAFGIFDREASEVLRKIWRAWCARARWDAKPLADAALAALQELDTALGRRRKGREEAEESLERLTSDWAEQSAGQPWCLIGVRIPTRARSTYAGDVHEPLRLWELAVVAVEWGRGTAALWVPQGIGAELLAAGGSMTAVNLLEGTEDWASPASTLLAAWDECDMGPEAVPPG
ncbi:hypothetical protein [Streptomyces apocyni]|uniref:hypothetical protein n=1 Tax=Streptomyces apocyni TaxID=2654677 RepID=UPI0012EB04F1|nr:hypothetical protein [Streptomyces apocyni]